MSNTSSLPPAKEDKTETFLDNGDVRKLEVNTREEIRSLEDLIRVFKIDVAEWDIPEFRVKSWEGYIKNAKDEIETVTLYAVSARLTKRKLVIAMREDLIDMVKQLETAALRKHGKAAAHPFQVSHRTPPVSRNCAEISIFDAHFGKQAWPRETADAAYDLKIATASYDQAFDGLLPRVARDGAARILIPIGNDQINSEVTGQTTAGTPQDSDSRHFKVVRETVNAIVRNVEKALQVAPVLIVPVPGNHDRNAILYISEILKARYAGHPHVEVDDRPRLDKYFQWGKCMMLFTHGSEQAIRDIPMLMATDEREMWGATIHREAHIGHFHKRARLVADTEENMGVVVRYIMALCPADAWHRSKGFVNNRRGGEAFMWDSEYGVVANYNWVVPPVVH